MIEIQRIEAKDTYAMRRRILRPDAPLEECLFPGDLDALTAHYGAFQGKNMLGILSIYKALNKALDLPDCWQLRAMAVKENARGKGYGLKLLAAAESYAAGQRGKCVWANARLNAVGFYKRAGYTTKGSQFIIPDVGPHYLVYKMLSGMNTADASYA